MKRIDNRHVMLTAQEQFASALFQGALDRGADLQQAAIEVWGECDGDHKLTSEFMAYLMGYKENSDHLMVANMLCKNCHTTVHYENVDRRAFADYGNGAPVQVMATLSPDERFQISTRLCKACSEDPAVQFADMEAIFGI